MGSKKLKVGLLIDSFIIPAWMFKIVDIINNSSYAEISLVVKNKLGEAETPFHKKLIRQYQHLLYHSYRLLENSVFKPPHNAFEKKDLHQLIAPDVKVLEVQPLQKKYADYLSDDDIGRIQAKEVDVLIRFGFRILKGRILTAARYGIWSFHHGDNAINRGGPAGTWEVLNKWDTTGSVLQILKEDLDGGIVLYRSWSNTYKLSINYNLNYYFWKSLSFLPRCLEKLHKAGEQEFFDEIKRQNVHPVFYSNRLFRKPKNLEFLKCFVSHCWHLLYLLCWRVFNREQWTLFYSLNSVDQFSGSLFRYKRMVPPLGKFWADPFVVSKDNRYYIFLEEYVYKTKKGHISLIEMDKDGNYSPPKVILEKPYHLSYPFVFHWKGDYYMIPESEKSGTIQLYRATGFPDKWEFVMNLMENVEAVDATIYFKENRVWLFVNIREWKGAPAGDELFLFYSEQFPTNKWIPHPKNPVISDVRSARPAGKLFEYNGNLYRPSQNGSGRYGYATNINHVVELTETDYREVKVSAIEPKWNKKILCTHSLAFDGKLTVVDALLKRSRIR